MKQFILTAYDATDEQAPARRQQNRAAHLASITEWRQRGHILIGVALTDETGKMIGSHIVTNFEDRTAFDAWLAQDPYTTGKVWQNVTVLTGALAPAFTDLLKKD